MLDGTQGRAHRVAADCSFSPCSRHVRSTRPARRAQQPRGVSRQALSDGRNGANHHTHPMLWNVPGRARDLYGATGKAPQRRKTAGTGFIVRPGSVWNPARSFLLAVLLLSMCCELVAGAQFRRAAATPRIVERRPSPQDQRAWNGEVLVDRNEPPRAPRMRVDRRNDHSMTSETVTSSAEQATSTSKPHKTTSTSSTKSHSSSSLVLATDAPAAAVTPTAFDSGIGTNFTSTCPPFLQGFLKDDAFKKCVPFSLLLQTSNAFFQASKSFVSVTQVLDGSCKVDFDTCNGIMQKTARQLRDPNNCGIDLTNNNPIVTEAHEGLISYQPMFQAGCQKDTSGSYCFANAITNSSSPADSFPYYLGVGVQLPGGARPTCNECLEKTMGIFANAASNGSQPVSQTYHAAAEQINIGCGPSFINETVRTTSAAAPVAGVSVVPLAALLAVAISLLF